MEPSIYILIKGNVEILVFSQDTN